MSKTTCFTCRYYPPSPERDKCPCPELRVKCEGCELYEERNEWDKPGIVKELIDEKDALEKRVLVLERALEMAVNYQPCENFVNGQGMYNEHQCYKCGGIVRFCDNCKYDHHDGGYRQCYIAQATAELQKEGKL